MSTTTTDPWEARAAASASYNGYRFYTFRIWYGMVASAWLSLLVRNRFVVSPARLPFTMLGFVTSVLNSILKSCPDSDLCETHSLLPAREAPDLHHWSLAKDDLFARAADARRTLHCDPQRLNVLRLLIVRSLIS